MAETTRTGPVRMMPKLSICIPTYNRAVFLRETLESIVDQGQDVEIVVTDNASEDDTAEVVASFQQKYASVRYFRHTENVGADRNYLKGVELASGEYCWLFGSDDVLKPGSIRRVQTEIETGYDVYLCGLTLCTLEMNPICDHRIMRSRSDAVFDLSDTKQRKSYFELAESTTALFSFLGSLIIKKSKWDAVEIDESRFIGSLWSHAAKIFGMVPLGLRVKYIREPLLYKRSDNDSFLDKGLAHRIGVSIDGYQMIGDFFFGKGSVEAHHVRRILKLEWPLAAFLSAKRRKEKSEEESRLLGEVFARCFSGTGLSDRMANAVFRSGMLGRFYQWWHSVNGSARSRVKKLAYGWR